MSKEATGAMLKSIQEMKFFLRMAFGDSKEFAGSLIDIKTQGLCQGNGAALAGWAVVSIAVLNAHKKKGHGAQFLAPISLVRNGLAAVLYVDDTDVIHLDMKRRREDVLETLHTWGRLLIATGGSLKPIKCFYHLISFSWMPDGTWVYDDNENEEELQLEEIPLPDGSLAPIEVMMCPSGDHTAAINAMKEKAQGWIDRAISAKMVSWDLWFLTDPQFWPKVGFGIGLNLAPYHVLSECLMKQYY